MKVICGSRESESGRSLEFKMNEIISATGIRTPLLASEHDDPSTLLLSVDEEEEEDVTEFSRLLSVVHNNNSNNSSSLLPNRSAARYHDLADADDAVHRNRGRRNSRYLNDQATTMREVRGCCSCSPYFVAIVAGASCILHVGFVWASFASGTWSETVLAICIGNQQQQQPQFVLPMISTASTNLASLLQQFNQADRFGAAALLWVTSLLVPCLFMVLSPSWIIQSFQNCGRPTAAAIGVGRDDSRHYVLLLQLTMRWAWTVVYVMACGIALACHYIRLEWTDTVVSVHTQATAGLASFAVGVAFAVLAIVALRLLQNTTPTTTTTDLKNGTTTVRTIASNNGGMREQDAAVDSANTTLGSAVRSASPIDNALSGSTRESRRLRRRRESETQDDESLSMMRILEEAPAPATVTTTTTTVTAFDQRCRNVDGSSHGTTATTSNNNAHAALVHSPPTSFFQILLVFQTGLLSILLCLPALLLPVIRLKFSGVAAAFMKGTTTHTVLLYEIPTALYRDSLAAATPPWIVWLIGITLFVPTVVCPVLATVFGIATWMLPPDDDGDSDDSSRCCCSQNKCWSRSSCRRWLHVIQPAMGGTVFALAIIVAARGMEPWSTHAFNESGVGVGSRSICDSFEAVMGEQCLKVTGSTMKGAWFYVAQTVLLEIFIVLTLRWS